MNSFCQEQAAFILWKAEVSELEPALLFFFDFVPKIRRKRERFVN